MEEEIRKAIEVLRRGGTLLYPTDTIWGVGCDATNDTAVEKILQLKKRNNPDQEAPKSFIVLVSDIGMLNRFIKEVPAVAWDLIEVSDSPLTIIYEGARGIAKNVLATNGSLGVRIVKDLFCERLIHKFGKPIVSTSANLSGQAAPQHFYDIADEIKQGVEYVVNWRQDDTTPQKASSIIKIKTNGEFQIIRK